MSHKEFPDISNPAEAEGITGSGAGSWIGLQIGLTVGVFSYHFVPM
jgi:hypothetical protein